MLDRSAILSSAWKSYRLARPAFFAAGDTATHRRFLRSLFGKMLRQAWADAKKAAVTDTASAFVVAQSRVMAEKALAMPAGERSVRIVEVRQELALLDYAPWGVRTGNRRHDLSAQLDALTAGAS
jgi:hypothetical protein